MSESPPVGWMRYSPEFHIRPNLHGHYAYRCTECGKESEKWRVAGIGMHADNCSRHPEPKP